MRETGPAIITPSGVPADRRDDAAWRWKPARQPGADRRAAHLATLLYHGQRRADLAALQTSDLQLRQGVLHLRVHGKRGKIRYVPAAPATLERIDA